LAPRPRARHAKGDKGRFRSSWWRGPSATSRQRRDRRCPPGLEA
jgi:hypothetical protein